MKKYKVADNIVTTVQEPATAYSYMSTDFRSILKVAYTDNHSYLRIIRQRVAHTVLDNFMSMSCIHLDLMAKILHLNSRTLRRLNNSELLNTTISEKLVELIRLYKLGHEVFGDMHTFNVWMGRKIRGLGYIRPIDIIDSNIGVEIVAEELERILHGVYA